MPIAMEESSNYKCSESYQSGGFFAVTKERRALMYAKLDKLREDLKKAVAKREAADAKVKQLEAKLKAGKDVTWLPIGKILHRSIVEKPLTRDQIRRIKERMQRAESKDSVIADLHEKKKEAARVPKKQGQQKEKGER